MGLAQSSGTIFGIPVTAGTWATVLSSPAGPTQSLEQVLALAVDGAGNLYIESEGEGLSVLPVASGTIFGIPVTADTLATLIPGVGGGSVELAVDAAGDLFIVPDSSPPGPTSVLVRNSGTLFGMQVTANSLVSVGGVQNLPYGMAVDAVGDVFSVDFHTYGVTALPEASGTLFGMAVNAGRPVVLVPGLGGAVGLATDRAGDVFIADQQMVPEFGSVLVLPKAPGTIFAGHRRHPGHGGLGGRGERPGL